VVKNSNFCFKIGVFVVFFLPKKKGKMKRKEKKNATKENYLENRVLLALASRRRRISSERIVKGE
jgi:hypothetical protein